VREGKEKKIILNECPRQATPCSLALDVNTGIVLRLCPFLRKSVDIGVIEPELCLQVSKCKGHVRKVAMVNRKLAIRR
jgi:hypothetical protein